MKFRIGDTVKFLSQQGGGKISKIVSPDLVNVAIEDGFEIPTLISDLVKIEMDTPLGKYFGESYDVPTPAGTEKRPRKGVKKIQVQPDDYDLPVVQNKPIKQEEFSRKKPLTYSSRVSQVREGVYLAFVPEVQHLLISGNINIYIINHTKGDILFSLFLKNAEIGYSGRDYDTLNANSFIHLDNITREEINTWTNGIVQVLFHENKQTKILAPLTAEFKIQGIRFYKEDNYQSNYFFGERAFIYLLGEISHQPAVAQMQKDQPYEGQDVVVKVAKVESKKELIENHKIDKDVAEVDLHISALRDDYSTMNKNEILKYQMDYCGRALENAMAKSYKSVIFIHGIGNGILRDAIIAYLHRNYPDIPYRKASFQNYGNGALELSL